MGEPYWVGKSAVSKMSLMPTGSPRSGASREADIGAFAARDRVGAEIDDVERRNRPGIDPRRKIERREHGRGGVGSAQLLVHSRVPVAPDVARTVRLNQGLWIKGFVKAPAL